MSTAPAGRQFADQNHRSELNAAAALKAENFSAQTHRPNQQCCRRISE
jgi:hypothetical protein